MQEALLINQYKKRLFFRIIIFIVCIFLYFFYQDLQDELINFNFKNLTIINVIWLILVLEMLLVFFPRSKVSMGSVKAFKYNYLQPKVEVTKEVIKKARRRLNIGAAKVALIWVLFNSIIATAYFTKIIREKELFLLSMAYYVADLICVVYFCPFQKFFMHNRCCVTCRIFNWDQLMMVTPLLFFVSPYSLSLGVVAVFTFIEWELTFLLHPERFIEETNDRLKCINCTDKTCKIKKPIHYKWKD